MRISSLEDEELNRTLLTKELQTSMDGHEDTEGDGSLSYRQNMNILQENQQCFAQRITQQTNSNMIDLNLTG